MRTRTHTHTKKGEGKQRNPLCTTTLSIIKKYGAAAGYHTRQRYQHTPTHPHVSRRLSQSFDNLAALPFPVLWQPRFLLPPTLFSGFLLCTRFRSLRFFAHLTHALSYANNIKQILALGATWLAKGPKISGRSYY
jgi:hypothetical protein